MASKQNAFFQFGGGGSPRLVADPGGGGCGRRRAVGLLISSVEADVATKHENKMVAESTEAWLMTLRRNLSEVEGGSEEAWIARRELAKLLVERIVIGRDEEGRTKVEVTYRFGPPAAAESADGVQNSEVFSRVHGQGSGEGFLRGHPQVRVYEIAVERGAERHYGPD